MMTPSDATSLTCHHLITRSSCPLQPQLLTLSSNSTTQHIVAQTTSPTNHRDKIHYPLPPPTSDDQFPHQSNDSNFGQRTPTTSSSPIVTSTMIAQPLLIFFSNIMSQKDQSLKATKIRVHHTSMCIISISSIVQSIVAH